MEHFFTAAAKAMREHRIRRRWGLVVLALAILGIFLTWYALILPAATLESSTCTITEHSHTAECYEEVLTCTQLESDEHTHDTSCYSSELTCTTEEHSHTADDTSTQESEVVTEPESGSTTQPTEEAAAETGASKTVSLSPYITKVEYETTSPIQAASEDESSTGATYNPTLNVFEVSFNLKFTLTKDAVNASDSYTYSLPSTVIIPDGLLGETHIGKDGANDAFNYTFVRNDDGTYSIQVNFLADYVAKIGDSVNCYIKFDGYAGEDALQGDGSLKVEFSDTEVVVISVDKIRYPDDETAHYDIDVQKTGGTVDATNNTITYTVMVTTKKGTPDPIIIQDALTADGLTVTDMKLSKVEKVTVRYSSGYESGEQNRTEVSLDTLSFTPSVNGSSASFNLELAGLGKNERYYITYTVQLDDLPKHGTAEANNTVTATATNESTGETVTDSAQKKVSIKQDILAKSGTYDATAGKIKWTITINSSGSNIAGQALTDSMLSQASELTITRKDGSSANGEYIIEKDEDGKITGIQFNATDDGTNTNTYTVTYYTEQAQTTSTQTVTNDASFGAASVTASVSVQAGGGLRKTFQSATAPDDNGLITMTWDLKLTVPSGGLEEGSSLQDNIYTDGWGHDTSVHWITKTQLGDLYQAAMNAGFPKSTLLQVSTDGSTWTDYSSASGETYARFRFYFPEGFPAPGSSEKTYTLTYSTVGNFSNVVSSQTLRNNVVLGNLKSDASYTYTQKVVKLNGNATTGTQDIKVTSSDDNTLYWYVRVAVDQDDYTLFTVTDDLPNNVEIQAVGIGASTSEAKNALTPVSGTTTIADDVSVSVTGTAGTDSSQTVEAQITGSSFLTKDSVFYLCYQCVTKDDLGADKAVYTYTNKVKVNVTANQVDYGSGSNTEKITVNLPTEADKTVTKSASWDETNHRVNYSVTINPDRADLAEGSDTLNLTDVFTYFYSAQSPIEASLVPSVKLYEVNANGEKVLCTDWTWTYTKSSLNGYDSGWMTHTISATIPDGKMLLLEYAYDINLDSLSDQSLYDGLYLENKVTLTGDSAHGDKAEGRYNWSTSSTSGGASTGHSYTFYKVADGNYSTTLSGAVFGVFTSDGQEVTVDGSQLTYTTNDSGSFSISQGSESSGGYVYQTDTLYYVQEIAPPTGYKMEETPTKYYFYFSSNGTALTDIPSDAVDLTTTTPGAVYVSNEKNTTSITVKKEWFTSSGTLDNTRNSGTVSFDVYQIASAEEPGSSESSGSSSGSGYVTFTATARCGNTLTPNAPSDVMVGSKVQISVDLNYGGIVWKPDVTLTHLNATDTGTWTSNSNSSHYTITATVEALNASISVNEDAYYVTVTVTKISDPESSDSSSTDSTVTQAGTFYKTYTLSGPGWSDSIELPKTGTASDGTTVYYTYYVVEQSVTNYETSYDNNDPVNGIVSGTITIQNTQSDTPSYALPSTGGAGTGLYTAGGLLLTLGAAFLMYKKDQTRKEDESH